MTWGVKEVEVGDVKEVGHARGALLAKHASTLSAVMATFEKREWHTAEEVVACGCQCIWLPEVPGEEDGEVLVGARGGWGGEMEAAGGGRAR